MWICCIVGGVLNIGAQSDCRKDLKDEEEGLAWVECLCNGVTIYDD